MLRCLCSTRSQWPRWLWISFRRNRMEFRGSSTLGSWTCTAFCAEDVWALNTIGSVVWKVTERGKSVGIAVGQLKRTCKGINSTYSIYYIVRQCMGCIVTAYIVDSVSASDKWYAESECYFKLNSSASGKIQEYEVR